MRKIKIVGTGLSGLIGTRIVELLKNKYLFEDLSLETGVDITDKQAVFTRVKRAGGQIILHLAAMTDVDACEQERKLGKTGKCWQVNVGGTRNIAAAARKFNKKVIYVSTDFVFNGKKESYSEEDLPHPVNWYGLTKLRGEEIIREQVDGLIVRSAFPYRARFIREDIVRFFLHRLRTGRKVKAIEDWRITPTFIDDFVEALEILIRREARGIYHLVGSGAQTPWQIANMVARTFRLDSGLIEKVQLDKLFAGKAKRPKQLFIKNAKISKLGITMRSLAEGLDKIKQQLAKQE